MVPRPTPEIPGRLPGEGLPQVESPECDHRKILATRLRPGLMGRPPHAPARTPIFLGGNHPKRPRLLQRRRLEFQQRALQQIPQPGYVSDPKRLR